MLSSSFPSSFLCSFISLFFSSFLPPFLLPSLPLSFSSYTFPPFFSLSLPFWDSFITFVRLVPKSLWNERYFGLSNLPILLPECGITCLWHYAYVLLGFENRVSCRLSRNSTHFTPSLPLEVEILLSDIILKPYLWFLASKVEVIILALCVSFLLLILLFFFFFLLLTLFSSTSS